MNLKEYEALESYARMLNTMNIKHLEPLLSDDFIFETQMVTNPLKSKKAFIEYMAVKLETIKKHNACIYAEMGFINGFPMVFQPSEKDIQGKSIYTSDGIGSKRPCLILAQPEKDNLVAIALAEVKDEKIKRIDLCIVPDPYSAERTGIYPGA
mgnify:CR=1 FL=1